MFRGGRGWNASKLASILVLAECLLPYRCRVCIRCVYFFSFVRCGSVRSRTCLFVFADFTNVKKCDHWWKQCSDFVIFWAPFPCLMVQTNRFRFGFIRIVRVCDMSTLLCFRVVCTRIDGICVQMRGDLYACGWYVCMGSTGFVARWHFFLTRMYIQYGWSCVHVLAVFWHHSLVACSSVPPFALLRLLCVSMITCQKLWAFNLLRLL